TGVGQVLAHEGVVETELVAQDDCLAVLAQCLRPVAAKGVHRHGEVAKTHSSLRNKKKPFPASYPRPPANAAKVALYLGKSFRWRENRGASPALSPMPRGRQPLRQ